MKLKQIFLVLSFLMMLVNCTNENEIVLQDSDHNTNKLIVVLSTAAETRTTIASEQGTKNILVKWKEGDQIQLFFKKQNETSIITGEKVTLTNLTNNNKTAEFVINLPQEINKLTDSYTIYGVHGTDAKVENNELKINVSMKPFALFNGFDIPMMFKTDVTPNTLNIDAQCKHLGALQIIKIKNTFTQPFNRSFTFQFADGQEWFYGNTQTRAWYNPEKVGTGAITGESITESNILPIEVQMGGTVQIASWVMPNETGVPEIKLVASAEGKTDIVTAEGKNARAALIPGKAYHLYAEWNGKSLSFSDENPTPTRPTLPIEYVAEYNINIAGDGFTENYFNDASGLFNWYEANGVTHETYNPTGKNILNAAAFKDKYHLPSHAECRYILPDGIIDWTDDYNQYDVEEEIPIHGEMKKYTADYDLETMFGACYAIRFKGNGDNLRAAYRYLYTDNPTDTKSAKKKMMTVNVRYLGPENTSVTLADITMDEFWNEPGVEYITRIFPATGYSGPNTDEIYRQGEEGFHWTTADHSPDWPNSAIAFNFYELHFDATVNGFSSKKDKYAIRPFKNY